MEERLLEIIKGGKGEVKDLIEAEKQLGIWREKIEKLEGEIRYYNNLVSLSTLTVTLAERDIRAAALLSETEQVNMGVEADGRREGPRRGDQGDRGGEGADRRVGPEEARRRAVRRDDRRRRLARRGRRR